MNPELASPDGADNSLETQWRRLLHPFAPDPTKAREVFADLVRRYSSADRFYHNLRHLREVLSTINELSAQANQLASIQLAAWFHDAVYDARAHDNEERSAQLCGQALGRLTTPPALVKAAVRMIQTTRTHAPTDDPDCRILLDADLGILGSPPLRYAEYAAAIRQEYSWLSDADYCAGRKRVLQGFLRRERIFWTELLRRRCEAQARLNMQLEVDSLAG